jgi:ribonuclease P protein component
LTKIATLNKKSDFFEFRRLNPIRASKFFIIKSYNNDYDATKFGIIITKKISKKAVDRNLIRRRIKSILHKFDLDQYNLNILLIVKHSILTATFLEIENDIKKSIEKIIISGKNDVI